MLKLQERLSEFLNHKNITMQTFERRSNISTGAGCKLSEKSRLSTFSKISRAFPDLNIDWLKNGEGEMINELVEDTSTTSPTSSNNDNTLYIKSLQNEIATLRKLSDNQEARILELKEHIKLLQMLLP